MNIQGKDDLRDALAAQYVLGTLRGHARRRFEGWLKNDSGLRDLVYKWQEHLSPLCEDIKPIDPPDGVWESIARRIPVLASESVRRVGWLESLPFWRNLAAAMTAVAVLAISLVVMRGPISTEPASSEIALQAQAGYVASIDDTATGRPVAVMIVPEQGDQVIFKVVASDIAVPQGKVLQLWTAQTAKAEMVSAGLVPIASTDAALRFRIVDPSAIRHAAAIGLSLEPQGGSPKPTQVLGVGKLIRIIS